MGNSGHGRTRVFGIRLTCRAPTARTVKAPSGFLHEASAELSTRYVKDKECWNESAACRSLANQEVQGSGRCGLRACKAPTNGKSR